MCGARDDLIRVSAYAMSEFDNTTTGILRSIPEYTDQSIYSLHIEKAGYDGYHYHGELTDWDVIVYIWTVVL